MVDVPSTFESISVGTAYDIADRYEVTRDEIVSFAEQYDPQPMHVDEAAAAESMFGGLVASGWHVCSMAMRLLVDGVLTESGAAGAIGVDNLRWHEPVRPGDVLRLSCSVEDKRPWSDSFGLVDAKAEVYNDADTLVLSFVGLVLWEREDD